MVDLVSAQASKSDIGALISPTGAEPAEPATAEAEAAEAATAEAAEAATAEAATAEAATAEAATASAKQRDDEEGKSDGSDCAAAATWVAEGTTATWSRCKTLVI